MHHPLQFDRAGAAAIINNALSKHQTFLTEPESKALLSCYTVPVNRTELASSPERAVHLAREIGYPVAMKICSTDISHKSDAHGVQLNLHNDEDIRNAFKNIMAGARAYDPKAEIQGATLQTMMARADYELILGSRNDPVFGPVLLFGMGGIMTEILKDKAIAFPPLNRLLARRLMESTRVYQLLKGYRNRPRADFDKLEEILISLSQLVTDFPEIAELDVNPLILVGSNPCAVDARVMLKPSKIKSPLHLVISPYPSQYEMPLITREGVQIFIRPIKPEDEPLLAGFFKTLSPKSIYMRFFSPMKTIPHAMMARFTQIDYDRDMALLALRQDHGGEEILGVARLMSKPGGIEPEFSVVVGDMWQGKGIGATLMERLMVIAEEKGMTSVWGVILGENTHMLNLARKFDATVQNVSGNQYLLRIDLKRRSAAESDHTSPSSPIERSSP